MKNKKRIMVNSNKMKLNKRGFLKYKHKFWGKRNQKKNVWKKS